MLLPQSEGRKPFRPEENPMRLLRVGHQMGSERPAGLDARGAACEQSSGGTATRVYRLEDR